MAAGPLIETLFADDHLIVVNKPSGLAVHRGWDADPVNALVLVKQATQRWLHPVHRLDRATSGALIFAFDPDTAARLQEALQKNAVYKRYLALVRGIAPEVLRIDHAIPKAPKGPRVDAITNVRRLGVALDRFSLVEAIPETGRLHQIRRHLKHVSHPIIGDIRYGDGKENRRLRAEVGLVRLALHARELRFAHPHTGEPIAVTAPIPDDLREPLERLGLIAT